MGKVVVNFVLSVDTKIEQIYRSRRNADGVWLVTKWSKDKNRHLFKMSVQKDELPYTITVLINRRKTIGLEGFFMCVIVKGHEYHCSYSNDWERLDYVDGLKIDVEM